MPPSERTNPAKPITHRGMLEMIIREGIVGSPASQAEPSVRKEAAAAVSRGLEHFSDGELYDIVQRVGNAEPHCQVSPFIHALCNLNEHYTRPA